LLPAEQQMAPSEWQPLPPASEQLPPDWTPQVPELQQAPEAQGEVGGQLLQTAVPMPLLTHPLITGRIISPAAMSMQRRAKKLSDLHVCSMGSSMMNSTESTASSIRRPYGFRHQQFVMTAQRPVFS
jgi:hypothetical protein